MNNVRRKRLEELAERIGILREEIEELRDEEGYCYDNLPESFQDGETGSKMQEAIGNMEAAIDSLDEAFSSIECARE